MVLNVVTWILSMLLLVQSGPGGRPRKSCTCHSINFIEDPCCRLFCL